MLLSSLIACGGNPGPEESTTPIAVEAPDPEPPAPEPTRPSNTIVRSELDAVLEAGLGRFLQGVETQPHVVDGRFVGFRLVSFYPDEERLSSVDLGPGDVVTRVNGQPIERPDQALSVWNGLRVASELWIEYLRGDEERELRYAIED
jgi:S1-C subfamily serine protease